MKSFKIIFILVIFFKTGNVLSENNLFNVNNVEIKLQSPLSDENIANKAIKKGFDELIERILIKKDVPKLIDLNFSEIKELVLYYKIIEEEKDFNKVTKKFNIFFDKDKIHKLFFNRNILYSDIYKKEFYLLPVLKNKNQYFIYSKNFFYERWNEEQSNSLVEFILPLENIEIIQKINSIGDNFFNLDLQDVFKEYLGKNLALVLVEQNNKTQEKVFLKTIISGKEINKTLIVKRLNLNQETFNKKIIFTVKKELINIAKSQNLIDIRTPSFLNAKFELNNKNNLFELNKRMQKIDLIENIYVQELNNKFVFLKIKYLGKVNKIISELKKNNIILTLIEDYWSIKII